MYDIIIYIYLLGVAVASLFSKKVRTMWRGERAAFKVLKEKVDPEAKYVWFHAASLGEFEQGRPIIERLRKTHPDYKILLTFFSPSGYEVRKNYAGAEIICYLPLDTRLNAIRFLRLVRPVAAVFIKYEFWYNYLHILKHRGIPLYSVSSIFRPKQIFFRWYGKQYAHVLKCFTHFFVQNDVSRQLLAGIGITSVTVSGDTRFDRVLEIKEQAKQLPLVEAFCQGKKTFVAGSSWAPDEDIFIPYFNEHKEWRLIIAPHVIDEDHLKQIEAKVAGKCFRYSQAKTINPEGEPVAYSQASLDAAAQADCLIIDCFGLLSSIYGYGRVAYVGGGFGVGIHNVLEAAVWSVPVFFGPNNKKFQEAQGLIAAGGGLEIETAEDFNADMNYLGKDEAYLKTASEKAGQYVKANSGAIDKVMKGLKF